MGKKLESLGAYTCLDIISCIVHLYISCITHILMLTQCAAGFSTDNLRVLPFMDSDEIIDELKHELPTYMAIADGTSADANKLEWSCK